MAKIAPKPQKTTAPTPPTTENNPTPPPANNAPKPPANDTPTYQPPQKQTQEDPPNRPQGQPNDATKETGVTKWFNDSKGFGFITPDKGGEDLFVNHTNINKDGFKTLKEGEKVEYNQGTGPKGKQAENVTPLEEATDKLKDLFS